MIWQAGRFHHQLLDVYSQSCHIYSGSQHFSSKTRELLVTVLSTVNVKKIKKNKKQKKTQQRKCTINKWDSRTNSSLTFMTSYSINVITAWLTTILKFTNILMHAIIHQHFQYKYFIFLSSYKTQTLRAQSMYVLSNCFIIHSPVTYGLEITSAQ